MIKIPDGWKWKVETINDNHGAPTTGVGAGQQRGGERST
jgi:hypothetical protein